MSTLEYAYNVNDLVLAFRPISAKKIVEALEISMEHAGFISHDYLGMKPGRCRSD